MNYELPVIDLEPIIRGEYCAFESMFKTVYRPMVSYAKKILKDETVAEEIVDDVLLNIWNNRAGLTSVHNFPSYLFLSIKNRAINFLSRDKGRCVTSIGDFIQGYFVDFISPEKEMLNRELGMRIDEVVETLPCKRKACFKLVKLYGFDYKETAGMMGISVKTVDAHLVSAMKQISQTLYNVLLK